MGPEMWFVDGLLDAFLPAASMHFSSQAMLWARVRVVCSPSSSLRTLSEVNPWIWFQYWEGTSGMLRTVK